MDWTILCDVSMSKSGRWVASLKDLLRLTWTVVISSRDRKVSQGFLVSQQARLPYMSNSKRLQPGTVCLSIFQHCMHTQWFLWSIHLGFLFDFYDRVFAQPPRQDGQEGSGPPYLCLPSACSSAVFFIWLLDIQLRFLSLHLLVPAPALTSNPFMIFMLS